MRNFKPPPFVPPEGVETFKDIQYSSNGHVRQKLDLYLPKDEALRDGPLPLIVYIHGRSLPELQQPQSFRAATELSVQVVPLSLVQKSHLGCLLDSSPMATPSPVSTTVLAVMLFSLPP